MTNCHKFLLYSVFAVDHCTVLVNSAITMAQEMKVPPFYKEPVFSIGEDGVLRHKGTEQLFSEFRADKIRVDKNDVYVTSYPKSGTQWLYSTVAQIYAKGDNEKFKTLPHNTPIDVMTGSSVEEKLKLLNESEGLRLFQAHLPFEKLPLGVQQGNCKVIHIIRNPKDVCVSFYYFHQMLKITDFEETFDSFLNYFLDGQVVCGGWFDNVNSWWQHRNKSHVLFIKYEELKKDNLKQIRRIAEFLGQELTDEEMEKVSANTTIKATREMFDKKLQDTWSKEQKSKFRGKLSTFVRKGEIGDWKNHFTVAQNEMFDEIYEKRMAESNLHMEFE